jgi:hypothetical protein
MRTGTALRAGAAVLAGLLAAAGLSACSGSDPKPSTLSPSPSPSTSNASPSPSATTPEQQVQATMTDYFDVTNEAITTGEVTALRAFSTSACPCRKAAKTIESTIGSGGHFEGLRYEVTSIKVHNLEATTAGAEVRATLAPYKVFDGDGKVTEDSPGGELHTDYSLVRSGDRWIIGNAVDLR